MPFRESKLIMNKAKIKEDEMRAEYRLEDLGPCVRGKYAARCIDASNVVVIDPELTKFFPNSKAVNDALRSLLPIAPTATEINDRSLRAKRKRINV
jgi:hypothetical protein